MVEHLHRASFHAPRVPREEMIDSLQDALKKDILYELPANYMVQRLQIIIENQSSLNTAKIAY